MWSGCIRRLVLPGALIGYWALIRIFTVVYSCFFCKCCLNLKDFVSAFKRSQPCDAINFRLILFLRTKIGKSETTNVIFGLIIKRLHNLGFKLCSVFLSEARMIVHSAWKSRIQITRWCLLTNGIKWYLHSKLKVGFPAEFIFTFEAIFFQNSRVTFAENYLCTSRSTKRPPPS